MLIDFTVANYRSLRDPAKLSMAASGAMRHRSTHVVHDLRNGIDLTKVALLYGANASGKSNLLTALRVLKSLVAPTRSRGALPDVNDDVDPFRLSAAFRELPTMFEIEFMASGTRYRYAISATTKAVISESLYYYPIRERLLFSRSGSQVELGPDLRGRETRSVSALVANRPAATFLSLLGEFGIKEVEAPVNWFAHTLNFILGHGFSNSYSKRKIKEDPAYRAFILDLLRRADTSIMGISAREESRKIPDPVRRLLIETNPGDSDVPHEIQKISVLFSHTAEDSEAPILEEDDESMGTLQLLALAAPLFEVLRDGLVLVFDELDTSLHPDLVKALVGLFHDSRINAKNAQLLATTHDIGLLDSNIVRPDNIWFAEKSAAGASTIYPLTDFKIRTEADLRTLYVQGRVGGIPAIAFGLLNDIDEYASTKQ